MCDDHHYDPHHSSLDEAVDDDRSWGLSRRGLFRGAAALTGGLLVAGPRSLLHPAAAAAVPATSTTSPRNEQGLLSHRHAMHVHTSYSEGSGSLEAQIAEASRNGFDTLWTTDHDWRMSAHQAPEAFHFPALSERMAGGTFSWQPQAVGSLSSRSGGVTTGAASPDDRTTGAGGLTVSATSSGTAAATYRYVLNGKRANLRHRTNLQGTVLRVEVRPQLGSQHAWGTLEIETSYRPATGGRRAGKYRLLYELSTEPASWTADGLVGRVRVPVTDGRWNTVRLDPVADLARLWRDLVAGDTNLGQLSLGATSRRRAPATVTWSWLRLERSEAAGDAPLRSQQALIDAYARRYPELAVRQAIEVSGTEEHLNWFGGAPSLIDYDRTPAPSPAAATALGHAYGCLVSLNHPLGSGGAAPGSATEQAARRRKVAARLLATGVDGVDVVEAGYRRRGGVTLETHLDLVDTFWRAGRWITATGVNDNHGGGYGDWAHEGNRFYTSLWQSSSDAGDALAALRRGAAFVGELGGFPGFLDLSADGAPMGSASIRPLRSSAELVVRAWDLPSGAVVEVVRGPVDYTDATDPGTSLLTELTAADLATGSASVRVPTGSSCFVRLQVRTSDGRRVAFTNPVFLLQEEPPSARALPQERLAVEVPV